MSAYTPDGSLVLRESRLSGADGTFRVRGLTTGNYRLRVSGGECGFTARYYDGVGQTSTNAANAVAVGTTRGRGRRAPAARGADFGTVTNTGLPTVTGTPEVGRTLTAGNGTWTPSDGLVFEHQWLAEGAVIPGATGSTYLLQAGDAGKKTSIRVTATRPTTPTALRRRRRRPRSQVACRPSPTPQCRRSATPRRQWGRRSRRPPEAGRRPASRRPTSGRRRVDIAGATSSSYPVAAGDEGKALRVTVTASRTGFTPGRRARPPRHRSPPARSPTAWRPPSPAPRPWDRSCPATPARGLRETWCWPGSGCATGRRSAGATGESYTTVVDDVGTVLSPCG